MQSINDIIHCIISFFKLSKAIHPLLSSVESPKHFLPSIFFLSEAASVGMATVASSCLSFQVFKASGTGRVAGPSQLQGTAGPLFHPITTSRANLRAVPILHQVRATSVDAEVEQDIQGLSRNYCDDFVCTSSPAVEATVRSLARDITRANGVWTRSLFSRGVEYRGFTSFKGPDGYQRLNFISKYVEKPAVRVRAMRMVNGSSTAQIIWNLQGTVGPFTIDVDVTTTITMNLLTGQIEKHTDTWDLRQTGLPGGLAFTAAWVAFTLSVSGATAVETTGSVLNSLTSMDEDGPPVQPNPNDPMRFFQQKDPFKEDAIFFLGGMLLLYTMFQAWSTLFKG